MYLEINEPFLAKIQGSYVDNLELLYMYVHIIYPTWAGTYLHTSKRKNTHYKWGPTFAVKKLN